LLLTASFGEQLLRRALLVSGFIVLAAHLVKLASAYYNATHECLFTEYRLMDVNEMVKGILARAYAENK
jgi:hypothetical protein